MAGLFSFLLIGIFAFKNDKEKVEGVAPKTKKAIVFFLVAYGISALVSVAPIVSLVGYYPTFTGGVTYLLFLLVSFVITVKLKSEWRLILESLVLTGSLVALIGIFEYLYHLAFGYGWFYRISSTIGQPNRLAIYLLVLIPIGWGMFQAERSLIKKKFYLVCLTLMTVAFFLTFSRTTYFAAICLGAIFLVVNFSRLKLKEVLVFVGIGFGLFVYLAFSSIGAIRDLSGTSLELRMSEIIGGMSAISNRTLLRQLVGSGPDTTYFTFFRYRPAEYNKSVEEKSTGPGMLRNHYLNILSTTGVIGLATYLSVFLLFLSRAYRLAKGNFAKQGIFLSFIAIGLTSFFYYQTEVVMVLFWVFGGLVVPTIRKVRREDTVGLTKTAMIFISLVGLGLVLTAGIAHHYEGIATSDLQLREVTKINPLLDVYQRNLSTRLLNEGVSLLVSDRPKGQTLITDSVIYARRALVMSPLDIRNVQQIVMSLYTAGVNIDKSYQKEALPYARQLVSLSPTLPNSWDLLGQVQLNLGDLPGANESFLREVSLDGTLPGAYLHLGEVAKQQGKTDYATMMYMKALELSPDWDLAQEELNKIKKAP